jgi:predicted nucleic acid-binding protein
VPLVVADTSPINLLVLVGQVHVLDGLFGQVIIPPEVANELSHPNAPAVTRAFIASPPRWLRTQSPTAVLSFANLDPVETAAISLAVELAAPLLIDERDGRAAATAHGVPVIGAVGVLERAANGGLLADLATVHAAIRQLPFHVADAILQASLARHLAHRAGQNATSL